MTQPCVGLWLLRVPEEREDVSWREGCLLGDCQGGCSTAAPERAVPGSRAVLGGAALARGPHSCLTDPALYL